MFWIFGHLIHLDLTGSMRYLLSSAVVTYTFYLTVHADNALTSLKVVTGNWVFGSLPLLLSPIY